MKFLLTSIVVLLTVHSAYSTGFNHQSLHNLLKIAEMRSQLEAELRAILSPAFKSALDDSIINLLDTTVRQIMKEGLPDLGIPVLDPLELEHLDINLELDEITISGLADGIKVEGISTFVVDLIKTNLLMLNAEFGFHLDEIVASGTHYEFEGSLGGLIPIYGNGAFSASVQGLAVSGKLGLGSNNSFIYVKSLDLDASLGGLTTNFEGLLGGGDLGEMANQIIADMAPQVFENAKGSLMPSLSESVINLANGLLDGVTLQDLLDLINGGGLGKLLRR